MPIDLLDSKEEVEEIIGFNMHNMLQFYVARSVQTETFVTRQPDAPRENSCTFLGHGRTAGLYVGHNRFCWHWHWLKKENIYNLYNLTYNASWCIMLSSWLNGHLGITTVVGTRNANQAPTYPALSWRGRKLHSVLDGTAETQSHFEWDVLDVR